MDIAVANKKIETETETEIEIEIGISKNIVINNGEINIEGIDKVILLRKLWENQIIAGFFGVHSFNASTFNTNLAKNEIVEKRYIDYFCGRAIKTNLSTNVINSYLYDRDAGIGAFSRIVTTIRQSLA